VTEESRDRDLWDPGAQPERTYQAWTRTALAFTACALLGTRLTGHSGVVALLVSLAGALAALAVVRVQKRRLHSAVIRSAPWSVAVMATLTVLLALAALTLVVLGLWRDGGG
jgi:uncharacterized membrane protein YidH (DUF202 family)